jgi:glutaredoxin 2
MSTDSTEISSSSTTESSSSSNIIPFVKPDRIVRDIIPVVYVYDHCPFCVRVRLALGLKNIKHTALFLANDDVQTPTALVGKKIAPILEWKEANVCMAESMDIIQLLDRDDRLGPTELIRPATTRTDIKDWQSSTRDLLRVLQRPRYVATGLLPEFQQLDGRHAFISKHPMPPYSKDDWKALTMADKLAVYAEAMAKDPAGEIEEVNRKLVELDDIIHCQHHCSPGGLGYDDIDLFSRLRSITIIRGVIWPTKLRQYMDHLSELADIPLYDEMAL